jgi:hypothetical protein
MQALLLPRDASRGSKHLFVKRDNILALHNKIGRAPTAAARRHAMSFIGIAAAHPPLDLTGLDVLERRYLHRAADMVRASDTHDRRSPPNILSLRRSPHDRIRSCTCSTEAKAHLRTEY